MAAAGAAGKMPWPVSGGLALRRAGIEREHANQMTRWTASALFWATGWAAAQGATPAASALVQADELLPTRMVLCQREMAGTSGDRKAQLRTCLARRLEGERLVERHCRRQVESVRGASERLAAQRACERQALAVPSSELPRRPPPPKPAPQPPTDGSLAPSAGPAPMPAAGDR